MLRNILKRGPLRYLLAVFMLAVAYGVTGKLGLLLATPPGYATAIWPPSGLALAALLVWGYRVWPGIALGSFLINLWTVATSHTVALPTFVTLAVCIGLFRNNRFYQYTHGFLFCKVRFNGFQSAFHEHNTVCI